MNDGYYVRLKYPDPPKVHTCKLPGWWDRFFMEAKLGAIWHCTICGQEWLYTTQGGFEYTSNGWEKTNVKDRYV